MQVSIYDGPDLVDTRVCRRVTLPDGSAGAIWRGAAYPLRAGDRIDIGDESVSPGQCRTSHVGDAASIRYALIEGEGEAYLVLDGSVIDAERAAAALREGGTEVLRSGRYLGDPVGPVAGDWFVRFVKPSREAGLASVVENLLGPAAMGTAMAQDEGRSRLLAVELAAARAREASLRSEIARLALQLAEGAALESERHAALERAVSEERALREAAELAILQAAAPDESPPARAPVPGKLRDELALVFESFLPRVRLLRDSLDVIAAEFGNRRVLYRGLAELNTQADGMPPNWKRVQGARGWWERHVSNGQDDAGRAYACLGLADRLWHVLVSHKGQQLRDITWLDRFERG